MNDTGRALFFLGRERRRQAWEDADTWRRLHRRPDAAPLPDEPEKQGLIARMAARIPVIRQVLPGST